MDHGPHQAPVRVLHLIDSLGPGGAERSLAELLPVLRRAGVISEIVCLFERTEGVHEEISTTGAPVSVLEARSFWGRLRQFRRHVKRSQPDVIHTTLFDADILGRCGAVGTGVPVLTSLVNTAYEPIRLSDPRVRRHRLWGVQKIDSFTARHLTVHFHAITNAVKESSVRHLGIGPEVVTVIPRGRDPSRLGQPDARRRQAMRERLNIPLDAPVLVNVARQEFQKGQRHLLEAVSLLRTEHPDLMTLVAGRRGNATGELRALHDQLGLSKHVRFLGHRDDVADVLACADVFVFPSLYEGLGGAILEAMALGLPVVASDLAPVREVVVPGVTAQLVEPGSAEDLARATSRYVRDQETAREHGVEGRRRFLENFTINQSGREMAALFRKVALSTHAPRPRSHRSR